MYVLWTHTHSIVRYWLLVRRLIPRPSRLTLVALCSRDLEGAAQRQYTLGSPGDARIVHYTLVQVRTECLLIIAVRLQAYKARAFREPTGI